MSSQDSSPSPSKKSPHQSRGTFWGTPSKQERPATKKLKLEEEFVTLEDVTIGNYVGKKLKVRVSMIPAKVDGISPWVGRVVDNTAERFIKGFNDREREKFNHLEFNRMYLISCFGVQAGYFDKSRLEITLKANTKFEEIPNEEDFGAIPVKRTLLKDFIEGQDYEYFDIIGVVSEVIGTEDTRDSKTGRAKIKTNLHLVDESKEEIKVVIWDSTNMKPFETNEVIIFRGVQKSSFTRREDGEVVTEATVSVSERTSHIWRNPERNDAETVKMKVDELKKGIAVEVDEV